MKLIIVQYIFVRIFFYVLFKKKLVVLFRLHN